MMYDKIRVSGIVEESIVDGPGIRCAIFVQGCPHNCIGCHNPHTHSFEGGYEVSFDEILSDIKGNSLITGVTFSGGEPMCQAVQLSHLAKKIKELGLEIAIYTGYTFEQLLEANDKDWLNLLTLSDILIDGKYQEDKRNLSLVFRGSSNQRILDLKQSLALRSTVAVMEPSWGG